MFICTKVLFKYIKSHGNYDHNFSVQSLLYWKLYDHIDIVYITNGGRRTLEYIIK